jgi:glucose/mannose transport system substrate-binding protein
MLGGDPPDSFQVHAGEELIQTWVVAGRMEDLTFLFEQEGWLDVFPQDLIDLISTPDGIWSVPVNIHRSNVMWYVPANLEAWGIEAPQTWDAFLEVCPAIQAEGVTPLALGEAWTAAAPVGVRRPGVLGPDRYSQLCGPVNSPSTTRQRSRCGSASVRSWRAPTPTPPASPGSRPPTWSSTARPPSTSWATGPPATWPPRSARARRRLRLGAVARHGGRLHGAVRLVRPARRARRTARTPSTGCASLGSLEGQDAFNPLKGSISAAPDSDMSLYNAYLQSAAADFASDRQVGSAGARRRG